MENNIKQYYTSSEKVLAVQFDLFRDLQRIYIYIFSCFTSNSFDVLGGEHFTQVCCKTLKQ